MLFRPNFCANCGVKIERAEWLPWTSRRFCQVCAIELKEYEIFPKALGVVVFLTALSAIGISYSSRSSNAELSASKQESRKEQPADRRIESRNAAPQVSAASPNEMQPAIRNLASTSGQQKPVEQRPVVEISEAPHYCGAETKKGTPCSRRVKGATRCFQHLGMPAMAVAETLDRRGQKQNRNPN